MYDLQVDDLVKHNTEIELDMVDLTELQYGRMPSVLVLKCGCCGFAVLVCILVCPYSVVMKGWMVCMAYERVLQMVVLEWNWAGGRAVWLVFGLSC